MTASTLRALPSVMPGHVPGIHVFLDVGEKDVDGRDEPGHDDLPQYPFIRANWSAWKLLSPNSSWQTRARFMKKPMSN